MKELIVQIVKCLVDNEDAVKVNEVEGSVTNVLEISVEKEDVGKVIGKQGNTAKALRTILKAASKKYDRRYILNILEIV